MDMTNKEYGQYVNSKSKRSPLGRDMVWAFLVGGLICDIGQALLMLYQRAGLDKTTAGTAVSITLIGAAALLTGLGLFDKLAKRAGAGTLVPITGFANAMVSPALEFKHEGFVTGTAVKLFSVAGPVLVFGISASMLYGMLLKLFSP
jgi:stage V sporulation protein AC